VKLILVTKKRRRNKEKDRIAKKEWYQKNKDKEVARRRKWNANNPEKYREHLKNFSLNHLQAQFGPDALAQYDEFFILQKGCCAICGKHQMELKRRLCLDHCHETGKLRGLLCSKCNTGIGMLGDDVTRLQSALRYLRENI
jgi:Autographiviridae endonuclease VII